MKVERVECFSDNSNAAVIRAFGRNYPGVLIQGDSLYNLCQFASKVVLELNKGNSAEAQDIAMELSEMLEAYKKHYEAVLLDAGTELPYP